MATFIFSERSWQILLCEPIQTNACGRNKSTLRRRLYVCHVVDFKISPSAESDGGRRLYTDKDIVTLHQIQSMKFLGFSLDDIKNRLISLDTPVQFADALTEQAKAIRKKITSLSEALEAVEKLQAETLQMKTVDFKKYTAIVTLL